MLEGLSMDMKKDKTMTETEHNQPFVFVTEFNDSTLKDFFYKFVQLEAAPLVRVIPVMISSYGGEVHVELAMRDIIKSSSKPVATIALGKAMSSGAALLAAGTPGLRFASPNTEIMIHEVSSGVEGKNEEIKFAAQNIESLNDMFFKTISEDTGMSVEDIKREIKSINNSDLYLTPKQAKKWGIIDHISVPRLIDTNPGMVLNIPQIQKAEPRKKKK